MFNHAHLPILTLALSIYKADVYSSPDDEYFLKPDLETTGGLAEFLQK